MTPQEFRTARAALGLSQYALAAVLRISRSHISHVEIGTERASEALCAHLRLLVSVRAAED